MRFRFLGDLSDAMVDLVACFFGGCEVRAHFSPSLLGVICTFTISMRRYVIIKKVRGSRSIKYLLFQRQRSFSPPVKPPSVAAPSSPTAQQ